MVLLWIIKQNRQMNNELPDVFRMAPISLTTELGDFCFPEGVLGIVTELAVKQQTEAEMNCVLCLLKFSVLCIWNTDTLVPPLKITLYKVQYIYPILYNASGPLVEEWPQINKYRSPKYNRVWT